VNLKCGGALQLTHNERRSVGLRVGNISTDVVTKVGDDVVGSNLDFECRRNIVSL